MSTATRPRRRRTCQRPAQASSLAACACPSRVWARMCWRSAQRRGRTALTLSSTAPKCGLRTAPSRRTARWATRFWFTRGRRRARAVSRCSSSTGARRAWPQESRSATSAACARP
eukprot:Amastigsp_a342332_40.p6 type:complete len:115 gc:universal Amastigsp_a342332_40:427-771(+)